MQIDLTADIKLKKIIATIEISRDDISFFSQNHAIKLLPIKANSM
jgi:hypothetical protein